MTTYLWVIAFVLFVFGMIGYLMDLKERIAKKKEKNATKIR